MKDQYTYKNAGLFGEGGLQAKVTLDVPDSVYLKAFGAITLALALGITIGAVAGRIISPKKQ